VITPLLPEAWLSAAHLLAQTTRNNSGSPPPYIFFIIGGFILLVILASVFAKRADLKRRAAARAALENRGLIFHELGEPTALPYVLALAPIAALATRPEKTRWSASGELSGVPVMAIEHQYSTGSGKNRQVHNHSVVSIPVPETWPKLDIYAENLFHRIGELFGSKDLKVEDEAFNKRFRVKGVSEDFALLFLTPEIQRLMLQWTKGTTLAIANGRLCISRNSHLSGEQWPTLLDEAVTLRSALPSELDAYV
jgi:hypothetical protein